MTVKFFITILLFAAAYAVNILYIRNRLKHNLSFNGVPVNLLFTFLALLGWIIALDMVSAKVPKTYLGYLAVGVLLIVYSGIAVYECKKIRDKL